MTQKRKHTLDTLMAESCHLHMEPTSTGQPSTTNTSKEYPSVVEKTCASRMFSPMSESKAES